MRKGRGTDDEHIRHVPGLQVAVDDAGGGVVAHDRAAGVVCGLVLGDGVRRLTRIAGDLLRAHRLADLGRFGGDVLGHLEIVLREVEGHAQERLAPGILVGRIEIEIILSLRHRAAVNAEHHRVVVVLGDRLLPALAPGRRAGRDRVVLNRPAVGVDRADERPTDEAQLGVIEIVAGEVVDQRSRRARRHEWIDDDVLVEERGGAAHRLVGVVAPHHALAGGRIVGLADSREQQHAHVVERE